MPSVKDDNISGCFLLPGMSVVSGPQVRREPTEIRRKTRVLVEAHTATFIFLGLFFSLLKREVTGRKDCLVG